MIDLIPRVDIVVSNLLSDWCEIPYAELSIVLVYLKSLYELHQNNHWISRGDAFYGDHMLFQRLYEKVAGEVDAIAEKAIGLGSERNVDLLRLINYVNKVTSNCSIMSTIPSTTILVEKSMIAEQNFLSTVSILVESLNQKGDMTRGLDNLLAGIEDTHEGHIYLLKQRINK